MKKILLLTLCSAIGMALPLMAAKEAKPAVNIGNIANKSGQEIPVDTFVTRLTDAIVNTRKFDVIESERIDEIVAEWNKANSGLTNGSTDPEDQKIEAVGYKLVPTITSFEIESTAASTGGANVARNVARLSLNVRFLNMEDGKIVASKEIVGISEQKEANTSSSSSRTTGDKFYQDCVKDASQKVVDALMDLCYPIKVMMDEDDGEVIIKVQAERVKEGDYYKVYRVIEIENDEDDEDMEPIEKEIATIKITDIRPTQSTAEVVEYKREGKEIEKGDICRPTNKKPAKKRKKGRFDDL